MSETLDQLAKVNNERAEGVSVSEDGEAEQLQSLDEGGAGWERSGEAALGVSGDEGGEGEGEKPYRIGDQSFQTQKEAFAYAESLNQKNTLTEAQSNAYRQAIIDAQHLQQSGQNVTPAAAPAEDDFDSKYYEDPKKYLNERDDKIRSQTKAEIMAELGQKAEEDKLWGEFFSAHPDLAGFKEDCEVTLGKLQQDVQNINATKGKGAAMDYLAQKTRAKFQAYSEAMKPRRELASGSGGPSQGSSSNVTRNISPEQPVDFTAQLRTLRSGRK